MIDWERFRRLDKTIDLVQAYKFQLIGIQRRCNPAAIDFLTDIEYFQPINSRQVAAVAIAQALAMTGAS